MKHPQNLAMVVWQGILLGCLLLSVGCGRSAAPQGSSPTPSVIPQQVPQHTLILWHGWSSPDDQVLARLIAQYNQQHPNVQVIPQTMPVASLTSDLQAAAIAGGGPHIVLLHNHVIEELALDGFLLPLDQGIRPEEYQKLVSTAVKGAEVRDKAGETHLYGLPLTFDTQVLFYERNHVTEAPGDIERLVEIAHTLASTPDGAKWGFAYTLSFDKTIGYLPAFGGKVFDEQGMLVLDGEGRIGTERWLQWVQQLHQDEALLARQDGLVVDGAIRAQHVWMTIDWSHMLPTYRDLWGDQLGVALLPKVAAAYPAQPYVQSAIASINARVATDPATQQAALDFIRFLLRTEAQQMFLEAGKQPALQEMPLVGQSWGEQAAQVCRWQAQQGQAMPNNALVNGLVRDELERMLLMVLRGLKTPSDAITDAHLALRSRLQELEDIPTIPPK